MSIKDIKAEARQKLALNMHQAIVVYTIEFVIFITLLALVAIAAVIIETATGATVVAASVTLVYGVALMLISITGSGLINYAMIDHYMTSYKCKPHNVRRIGEMLARSGITKIFTLNLIRTLLGFLLSLLLIVPGVIYLVRTSMANHLLIANPKMKPSTALSASSKVMGGKTGTYFGLVMSFIGWYVLCILTLGIGFIFVLPYVNLAKTVYYKRNLQGDKTVFNAVSQPQSPEYAQSDAMQYAAAQASAAVDARTEQVRVVTPDSAVPPIESLGADDIMDMNDAMRDFGADVPEVPLTPVTSMRKTDTVSADIVAEPMVAVEQDGIGPEQQQLAPDSDILEIVTPLTTQELQASDEIERRRIDSLYTGAPSAKPKRDYISHGGRSYERDGFVDSFDDPIAAEPIDVQPASEEPVVPDAQFDAFIEDFGVPKQEGAFTPLRRSPHAADDAAVTAEPVKPASESVVPPRGSARPAPTTSTANTAEGGESRADRIRREREERIQKLRNSRK